MNTKASTEYNTILTVANEAAIREMFDEVLPESRYNVLTSSCTAEARCVLQKNNVAVVICDQEIQGEDGMAFLTELQKVHPALERILVTDQSLEFLALRDSNEAGPPRYIRKPCAPQELLHTVDEALQLAQKEPARATACRPVTCDSQKIPNGEKTILQRAATKVLGLAGLALAGLVLFALLYLVKCLLGIDLFPEKHLKDML